jgi:hypothetical protein
MLSTPMQWRHNKLAVVLFLFTIAQLQSIGKTTLVFAAPHVSLDVNFENLKEKLGSHINTEFHLKYYW